MPRDLTVALEGAFQLHYLCRNGAEHDEFLRKLDTGFPPEHPFPTGTGFLSADELPACKSRLAGLP